MSWPNLDALLADLERDVARCREDVGYADSAQARRQDQQRLTEAVARLAEWREVRRICEESDR